MSDRFKTVVPNRHFTPERLYKRTINIIEVFQVLNMDPITGAVSADTVPLFSMVLETEQAAEMVMKDLYIGESIA